LSNTASISRRPIIGPTICVMTAAALLLAEFPIARAATPMTRADYETCQARDEQGFRAAIQALTYKSLEAGIAGLDYKAIVSDAWRRQDIDDVIDRQVDQSIGQVRDESSWLQLWQSLASKDKAAELATTAAERVYRSDALKTALAGVATDLGKEIGQRIELAIIDTEGPATQCMHAFLGARYGQTIARIVATGAGKEYTLDPARGGAQVSTGQVIVEGSEGMAGAVILVVRRQLSNMASRIGQRVVGSILSRLVSVVAGGVGLVLIAKDIWDFRHGVLPIIAEEMKAKATKERVREELAKSVSEQIADSLKDISEKTADRVLEIWLEFRRAHAKVVDLAERQNAFRPFLDTVKGDDLPATDEIVGLVLASEGEAAIAKRLGDGTLHYAVSGLPRGAMEIAREQRSLETALQWSAVAGDSLPKVVEYEIFRHAKPEAFTKASLQRLLALQDRTAIVRLAALSPGAREPLFELDANELKTLARSIDDRELDSLSRYLTGLERPSAQRVLRAVAQTPSRMVELAKPRVVDGILASSDQAAAVAMMLQADSLPDPQVMMERARLVIDGRVSPVLLWEKYPITLLTAGALLVMVLALMKRLLLGTRPKVIVHGNLPAPGRGRGARG
jgi:hypothetical protein